MNNKGISLCYFDCVCLAFKEVMDIFFHLSWRWHCSDYVLKASEQIWIFSIFFEFPH